MAPGQSWTMYKHYAVLVFALAVFTAMTVFGTALETGPGEALFCASIMIALVMMLTSITRRPALSMLVVTGLVMALRGISLIKMRYLGMPLFPPDLLYFGNTDTSDVIAHYPKLWHGVIKKSLVAAAIIIVCWRWEIPVLRSWRLRWRLPAQCAGLLLGVGCAFTLLAAHGPFKRVIAKDAWTAMNRGSPLTVFILQFRRMHIIVPEPDPALADKYPWGASPSGEDTGAPMHPRNEPYPDIVVVLEESTFDPHMLADCNIAECASPLFDADDRTVAHGPLRVHTFGGGTWTSEFALFTGLPNQLFGPGGFYAPFNLAPRVRYSLPRVLKANGYKTIAVYPMPANFVGAKRAYEFYGFDNFHDSSEFSLTWTSPDLAIEQEFERIYRRERAASDKPLFLMLLTMRQHGPHDEPLATLPAPFNHPLFPGLDAARNINLDNYLARLGGSLAAIDHLQATLFNGTRPVVFAHFGDHRPSFDGLLTSMPDTKAARELGDPLHLTYYMIRSNRAATATYSYPALDLGFLGGLILDVADVPKDPFFTANAAFRERCRGAYLDCPDKAMLNSYLSFIFTRLHSIDR